MGDDRSIDCSLRNILNSNYQKEKAMLNVGIDWGETTPNEFAILTDDGKVVKTGAIERSVTGTYELIEQIKELQADPNGVRIGIDRKNDVIIKVLCSQGYEVFPLNPRSADRAREIYYAAGQKDDSADCRVHAHMVRTSWRNLRAMSEDEQKDRQIRQMLSHRNNLVDTRAQNRQRLGSVLAEASPVLSDLCEDFRLEWVKDLLRRWPLEQDFTDVHGNALNDFLEDHPRISESTRKRIRSAWEKTAYEHCEQSAECYRIQIRDLMRIIDHLDEQIQDVEQKISELAEEHPDQDIFSSLPTTSETTIAALCTAFGPDRDEPEDWRHYSAYYGTSPITEQSGSKKLVKMRRARDETMHKALLDFADSTRKKTDCWAYTYYENKRNEGKSHYHALRCLGSRWIKILHAMWRNRSEYDEDFHQRRRRQKPNMAA